MQLAVLSSSREEYSRPKIVVEPNLVIIIECKADDVNDIHEGLKPHLMEKVIHLLI